MLTYDGIVFPNTFQHGDVVALTGLL